MRLNYIFPLILFLTIPPQSSHAADPAQLTEADIDHVSVLNLPVTFRSGKLEFPLSLGSGLALLRSNAHASVVVAITDRGPNAALPKNLGREGTYILPAPEFSPSIAAICISGGAVHLTSWSGLDSTDADLCSTQQTTPALPLPFLTKEGASFSGLPPENSGQLAVNSELKPLLPAPLGIDPEGIAWENESHTLWLAEEYGPSILAFDLTTRMVKRRLDPGNGLPMELRNRKINRGFEGIAVMGPGKVVASLQSPILLPSGKDESFLRIVVVDTIGGGTKTLALPLLADYHDYKIGDLVSIGDEKLLAIESYEDTQKNQSKSIVMLDLKEAKDISPLGGFPEPGAIKHTVTRTRLLDLTTLVSPSLGKIEGLSLLPDRKTVLLSEDSDFGLDLSKSETAAEPQHSQKIKVPQNTSDLFLVTRDKPTRFLVVTLTKPIH